MSKTHMPEPSMLRPEDVANDLQITRRAVIDSCRLRRLPAIKVASTWRIPADLYAEWKAEHIRGATEGPQLTTSQRRAARAALRVGSGS